MRGHRRQLMATDCSHVFLTSSDLVISAPRAALDHTEVERMTMTEPGATIGVKPDLATRKLSIRSVIGYGAGDAANNLAFSLSTTFLLLYYTDVVGLPAAAIGTMFLIVRLWDAFADLFAGRMIDRTMTRWGKFRPFILFGVDPAAGDEHAHLRVPAGLGRRRATDVRLPHLRRARPALLAWSTCPTARWPPR